MQNTFLNFISHSEKETIDLATDLTKKLKPGDVITLSGDLGAGKTTFVKGVGKALGVKDDIISPTFNILKCYFDGTPNLFHIDAYRLEDNNSPIGLEEFIEGDGICMIEWPNFIENLIPKKHLEIQIKHKSQNERVILISSINSSHFDSVVNELKDKYND